MEVLATTALDLYAADPDSYPTYANWQYIPYGTTSWFKYGSGGIAHSGSLCGVPNSCCAVLNLINKSSTANLGKIMDYYSQTEFPTSAVPDLYDEGGWVLPTGVPVPIPDNKVLARTTSHSPLCHVSISKWCDMAGILMTDNDYLGRNYKKDRCAKITADLAAFTAELINGSSNYSYEMSAETATCIGCHDTDADSVYPAQQGTMDCAGCHTGEAVIVGKKHFKGKF